MAEPKSTANQRLTQIKDFLTMNKTATTIPWDPNCTKFPTRKELPQIPGAPPEAAWVWGDNDYVSEEFEKLLGIPGGTHRAISYLYYVNVSESSDSVILQGTTLYTLPSG